MTMTLVSNRYRVVRELGKGGFGTTSLVEDTQLPSGRRCVLKELMPVESSAEIYTLVKQRFEREAVILEELVSLLRVWLPRSDEHLESETLPGED